MTLFLRRLVQELGLRCFPKDLSEMTDCSVGRDLVMLNSLGRGYECRVANRLVRCVLDPLRQPAPQEPYT
jgi:hypothetical protein